MLTSHLQIFYITFWHSLGCWFVRSSHEPFSYKTNKPRSSSNPCLFFALSTCTSNMVQLTQVILSFSSKTLRLGEFLHEIGQTSIPQSILSTKQIKYSYGKTNTYTKPNSSFQNGPRSHSSHHNIATNNTTVQQGEMQEHPRTRAGHNIAEHLPHVHVIRAPKLSNAKISHLYNYKKTCHQ